VKIFLGIDPGLADTGYGLVAQSGGELEMIDYGSIQTSKKEAMPERLKKLAEELAKIILKHRPAAAAIEKLFFCANVTTAMAVGQARGVAMLALAQNQVPFIELTPLQVKQATTGYGKADKKQMQKMVKLILKLKEIPRPDDAADALALAICAAGQARFGRF